jgi:hypothetical protein
MYKVLVLFTLLLLSFNCSNVLHTANLSSGEPEFERDTTITFKAADSYGQALQVWKTAEDINAWIAANFTYDMARAMNFSENQRIKNERISIYDPSEFFEGKAGVCVDLARFSVETLRRIDPNSDPKYLMIEFDPIQIKGNTLRLHWLVSFRHEGKIYFFSDSKRPGHIAGPYNDSQAFIKEYEQYRGRKIVSFRELESYQKQRRIQVLKRQATEMP